MAVNVSIARRYARALIDVAAEAQKLDRFGEQLEDLVADVQKHPELRDVFENPAYTASQRRAVLDALVKVRGGADPLLQNFLHLLTDRGRLPYLADIARVYRTLADARAGRVRGRVTAAVPLPPDALGRIERVFQSVTQKNVVMESKVDPKLLGGVSAQVGSVVYDGSLRTQLEELRRTLQHGR